MTDKKLTPIQEAIERLHEKMEKHAKEKNVSAWAFTGEAILELKSLLPKEREVIETAFEESRLTHPMVGFKHDTFEEYFTSTFKGE